MKKLSVLLATLLLTASFAACAGAAVGDSRSGESAPAAPETASGAGHTVQLWAHVNEAWNQSHLALVEKFNDSQPQIVVEATFFPYSDFESKIQTSLLSGGDGADLYEIWGGWAPDFIAADALSPVPEQLMADLAADCYEPVVGAFKSADGSASYGVPLEYNIEYGGMLVNKPRFEEKGLAYPATWGDMVAAAKATAVPNGELMDMRGLDFTTNDTLTTTFLSMILSQGGDYLRDGKIMITSPEAVTAMQFLVDLVVTDRVTNLDSATGAAGADVESYVFLARDEAMMVPRGPWSVSELETAYGLTLGVDFDYIAQPFYGPVKAFPAETGWGMCVPKAAKNADAAWSYTAFLMEKENLAQHNIRCGMIPPRKSIAEDPAYVQAVPYAAPLLEVLQYGKYIGPLRNTDVLKDNIRQTFISLCISSGADPGVADALQALEAKLNTELKLG